MRQRGQKIEWIGLNQRLLNRLARRFGVEMVILFGSILDPRRLAQDVDVALVMAEDKRKRYEKDIDAYTELWRALGGALGISEDRLDITFVSPKTPPLLLYYIARDGKLLYGRYSDFSLFRLKAMKIFFDTEIFRQALDRYLKRAFHVR